VSFQAIPAIDLRAGRVVRLRQGDYAQQTAYAADPLELAKGYRAAGARWLHVVDLDGARSGRMENLEVIQAVADVGLQVQAGGGVRRAADVQHLLDAGVQRVVLGSVAVREPDTVACWLRRYGAEQLTIALDARWVDGQWTLASDGWTASETRTLDVLAPWYAACGARHVLCTDIGRDGMLAGFNLALYRHLARLTPTLRVQASGGVRSVGDIRAARRAGAAAAILGRALLERHFRVEDALAC
jgi:phosphoribosylformimino-5-aminoimidazole carboxamide ribotide isomerase